jgi:hypothetical protein
MPRPSRPWFRFYVETFGDPKIRMFPLGQRWIWAGLLAAARMSPEPGKLLVASGVPHSNETLAEFIGAPVKDVKAALGTALKLGIVTQLPDSLQVTNFEHRQYESDTSTARTRVWRDRHKPVTTNGVVTSQARHLTLVSDEVVTSQERHGDVHGDGHGDGGCDVPETETDTETETDPKNTPSAKPRTILPKKLEAPFAAFWTAYPRKVGKIDAERKFMHAVVRSGVDPQEIVNGALRYAKAMRGDEERFIAFPATWLHRGSWADALAPAANGQQRVVTTAPRQDW